MNEIKFPSNAEVYVDQLKNLQIGKSNEISNTINDFHTYGIVEFPYGSGTGKSRNFELTCPYNDDKLYIGNITGGEIGGIAYNRLAQRIMIKENTNWQSTTYIPPAPIQQNDPYGNPLKRVSGNIRIPYSGKPANDYYVWIDYLQVVIPTGITVEDEDGNVWLTEYEDGYEIFPYETTAGIPPSGHPNAIYLGKVSFNGTVITALDMSGRTYCRQKGTTVSSTESTLGEVTFEQHINSHGSGSVTINNPHGMSLADLGGGIDVLVSTHQERLHSKGLVNITNLETSTSALNPSILGTQLIIKGLASTEYLIIQSTSYDSSSRVYHQYLSGSPVEKVFGDTYAVDFNEGGGAATGYYYFFVHAIDPAFPQISFSFGNPDPGVESVNASYRFVICSVRWNNTTKVLDLLKDHRTFRNLTPQNAWKTEGRGVKKEKGAFGFNLDTRSFEGFDGDFWLQIPCGVFIQYTTNGTPDTEDTIFHNLGRIPRGFIVVKNSNGGVVYNGTTDWTTTAIYLRCTTANNEVTILVF